MLGRGVPIFFRVCIMFVTPLIMFKIANALKPTSQWKPVGQDYEAVSKKKEITDMNLLEKIKLNLLGETNA